MKRHGQWEQRGKCTFIHNSPKLKQKTKNKQTNKQTKTQRTTKQKNQKTNKYKNKNATEAESSVLYSTPTKHNQMYLH